MRRFCGRAAQLSCFDRQVLYQHSHVARNAREGTTGNSSPVSHLCTLCCLFQAGRAGSTLVSPFAQHQAGESCPLWLFFLIAAHFPFWAARYF